MSRLLCKHCGKGPLKWVNNNPDGMLAKCVLCGETSDFSLSWGTEPATQHPLTIPGELLAEACELGEPTLFYSRNKSWYAEIDICNDKGALVAMAASDPDGEHKTPAEALSAAIAKAREFVK